MGQDTHQSSTTSSESAHLFPQGNFDIDIDFDIDLDGPREGELIAEYIERTYLQPLREAPPSYNHASAPNPPPYKVLFPQQLTRRWDDHPNNEEANDTFPIFQFQQENASSKSSKSCLNTIRLFSCIATIIINLTIFVLLSVFFHTFTETRYTVVSGYHVWLRNPKHSPSFLLLSGSGVTVFLFLPILFCLSFRYEPGVDKVWKLLSLTCVLHYLERFLAIFSYWREKGGRDLRGCSFGVGSERSSHHGGAGDEVDLERLCTLQTTAWILSILEIVLILGVGLVYLLFSRRYRGRRFYRRVCDFFTLLETRA